MVNLFELNPKDKLSTLFNDNDIAEVQINGDYYLFLEKGEGQVLVELFKMGDINEESEYIETVYGEYTVDSYIASLNPYTINQLVKENIY